MKKNFVKVFLLLVSIGLFFNQIAQAQAANDGFDPNSNGAVITSSIHSDGKILIGGFFTSIGGQT
ncbi:MAG: hypothetical protein MUC29_07545, partial [Pyrinomonadaceae bacterium]|nr:hypothetical protein [Pyrinomonadaceae bacterium]